MPPLHGEEGKEEAKKEAAEGESTFGLTEIGVAEKARVRGGDDDTQGLDDRFIAEIMMNLDSAKIATLRKAFEQNDDDGLSLAEFVHVMTSILDMDHFMTDDQFAANLIEFFDQVDINGDGSMEWEEFTSFIVEMGMSEHEHQPDAISKFFFVNSRETGNHNMYVHSVRTFKNDMVAIFDVDSPQVRLYNSRVEYVGKIVISKGHVKCCEWLEGLGQYAVSSTDLSINFYDGHSYQFIRSFRTPSQNTTVLHWIQSQEELFSGDTKGHIKSWDCQGRGFGEEKYELGVGYATAMEHRGRATGTHRDIVMDIIELKGLDIVASCSMDRTIKLWDLSTRKLRRTLFGHNKGVKQITYSSEYRFLISVGFDFDVLVWNPYVANLILRLSDHTCSLCGARIVPSTPILLTADVEGNFKVWDVRNFFCVQSFKAEESQKGELKGFANVRSNKMLVACGRAMHIFDYEKIEKPELTDEMPLCSAMYNATTSTFITVSGKHVKIWDAADGGGVSKVYRNLIETEITAMCLDFRERKFILGDHFGNLYAYDFLNGAKMKEFAYEETDDKAHTDEISRLLYCNEHATVVSVSWDRSIAIHSESEAEEGVLLRRIENAHSNDITALAHSFNLSLIATGGEDCIVKVWDYEFCRLESSLFSHTSPVTCLKFLDPFPVLMSCDAGGNIMLWATRP
eukprot:CAMPEP_0118634720 /NCGR_PEP_ID=MMETSP0785-20121206/1698_1 /TAXON_ID=91992 /ORGANISM="Bolidomonas pacifica, Strain CCMP 1866" /LENGTH=682 /DNA_ID=CAMNT_0006525715 /DNA_START=109 /DNA_END=2154 /DNA_ORIENTATION=+